MGKLLGIPMGMAPCYTLHSEITMEGQQIATELLTAAGANFFMDVYLSVDRMLAYFDTSAHDDQTLREIHGLEPAAEFTEWAMSRGIFSRDDEGNLERGANWGNPRIFCSDDAAFETLRQALPAAYGWETAGPRPANGVSREIKANLAAARQAIYAEVKPERLGQYELRRIATRASSKVEHLNDPELGARIAGDDLMRLQAEDAEVQILVSDGLSAEALHHNIPKLLPVLMTGLSEKQISFGQPMLAEYGRVKLAEAVGDTLRSRLIITLIGERPGGDAQASRSMSAYLAYRHDASSTGVGAQSGNSNDVRYEYSVISNIYREGMPPEAAGKLIAERAAQILKHRAAGNRLESALQQPGSA